jgi:hypothetical protein
MSSKANPQTTVAVLTLPPTPPSVEQVFITFMQSNSVLLFNAPSSTVFDNTLYPDKPLAAYATYTWASQEKLIKWNIVALATSDEAPFAPQTADQGQGNSQNGVSQTVTPPSLPRRQRLTRKDDLHPQLPFRQVQAQQAVQVVSLQELLQASLLVASSLEL